MVCRVVEKKLHHLPQTGVIGVSGRVNVVGTAGVKGPGSKRLCGISGEIKPVITKLLPADFVELMELCHLH